MLYESIPKSPCPYIVPPKPTLVPHSTCVISYVFDYVNQLAAQLGKLIVTSQAQASASSSRKAPSSKKLINVLIVKSKKPKNTQQLGQKKNE